MNKTIVLPKITEMEKDRADEIEFVMNMRRIFDVFGHDTHTYDLLENLAVFAGISITLIKTLATAVTTPGNVLVPEKNEEIILLYRMNYTIEDICKYAVTSTRTIYRVLNWYQDLLNHPDTPRNIYLPRMKEEYIPSIRKFNLAMKELRKL